MIRHYELGDYTPENVYGNLATQCINEVNEPHGEKIQVHGDKCRKIARKIVAFLNALEAE